ncbi:MAG: glucose-1-phosphate adenylyltransferase [Eubacteriales bacterium]
MIQKECVAMILAGGQGSRLCPLTEETAKPAVGFGGKYLIIDFTLSNCVNSGIDTVGVLTQYRHFSLHEHLGDGRPWGLDKQRGGLRILPPYQKNGESCWYKGTANAIYQNKHFIDRYAPRYVLILSGDHIYRMDYSKMLSAHKKNNAVCTVATIMVPLSEAGRFGICNTREDGSIYEFEEKPKVPKNNQASMGIYIFNIDTLYRYLDIDEADPHSANDFGRNVIPNLLYCGERLYAYPFLGYWKDVGTIQSLWEANMELLQKVPGMNLWDSHSPIGSRGRVCPPQWIGNRAKIENSLVSEGCVVNGEVIGSVLSRGVTVEEGATVSCSVLLEGVHVGRGAAVYDAIVDCDTKVPEFTQVGRPQAGKENLTVMDGAEAHGSERLVVI